MNTKLFIYVIIGFAACFFCSCERFLEEEAEGRIDSKYAETAEGAEKEVLALYQVNADLFEHMYMVGEMGDDLKLNGGNTRDYWKGMVRYEDRFMMDNSNITNYWKWLYVGVVNANIAINSITNATFEDESKRNQLLSEVHALRAFYNFYLIETYGPAAHLAVDVVTTPGDVSVNQVGIAAFYKDILADLDIADQHLPLPSETRATQFGRMDAGIAQMIRLRALMSLAGNGDDIIQEAGMVSKIECYTKSAEIAENLINGYGYRLEGDYSAIFDADNENSSEVIWSIQYNNSIYSSNNNHIFRYWTPFFNRSLNSGSISGLPSHSVYYGREYRTFLPTLYFIQVFDKADKRRNATFDWAWCRIDDDLDPAGASPIFGDTLLIRSLDVLSEDVKQSYRDRGIACDDISDIYDLSTGVPKSVDARSNFNSIRKWQDITRLAAKQEYAFRDAILMRLGEVYITLAEAYIHLGEKAKAAQIINELRRRAVTTGLEEAMQVGADNMTIPFILDEGARELGAELFRWYMLKRALQPAEWVKWLRDHNPDTYELDTDVAGVKTYHYYRPIPRVTIDDYHSLGLTFAQNEGYTNF